MRGINGSIGRCVTAFLCGDRADAVNGEGARIAQTYAEMFHVKHRASRFVGERRRRKWFHVKHRAALRGLASESIYAKMFHVKHRSTGVPVSENTKSAKQPHASKNRRYLSKA
jgi:hypothetical protein